MSITGSILYKHIVAEDRDAWIAIIVSACLAGLLQGCILVIINQTASNIVQGGLNFRYLILFCLTVMAYSFTSYYSSSRTTMVTEEIISSTYIGIVDKIRNTKTDAFESIRKSRIYSTLYTNTDLILETSKSLAGIGTALVMVVFSFVYIAIISHSAIFTIIIFCAFGIFVYQTNLKQIRLLFDDADLQTDRFKSLFSYFLEGFKEFKVDHSKSEDLFSNYFQKQAQLSRHARIQAEKKLSVNTVFIQSFYYVIIAAVLFLLPRITHLEPLLVVKVAAAVLFSYGSMTRLVLAVPLILKAEKAIEKLHQLDEKLEQSAETARPYSGQFSSISSENVSLQARSITFHYSRNDNDSCFKLGPVSLDIHPGQLIFVAGSNGSGKTTLLKLLCGLYQPDDGEICLNKQPIGDNNYADYRNLFYVIFSDYYIFDRFYGRDKIDKKILTETLSRLGLEKSVGWINDQFSEFNLSTGQMKRLALLCLYLDDSPIIIMDEVAADLDPQFRQFFYETFLQELISMGKTIIAVSHDDRYFHLADQLVRVEHGMVVS